MGADDILAQCKPNETGCLVWPRAPYVQVAGRLRRVQRVVYPGPVAPKKAVRATCGNDRCCAPGHLRTVWRRGHVV